MNPHIDSAPRMRTDGQRIAILLFAILQIVVTFLPALGLGDQIGERSAASRTPITPAGWAFSIWGPLYAGSLAYAVYQFAPRQRDNPLLARIGWASAGAFLGNAVWAIYTQFEGLGFPSALIIAFTLICLLHVYRTFAAWPGPFTAGERFLVVLPLSALAAWLSAATIVNIAATLNYHGVDFGASAPMIAGAVVIVGGLIAAAAIWNGRGNPWYAAVFLWALAAIYAQGGQQLREVAIAVIVAAILVAVSALARLARPRDRNHWLTGSR